jgi:hypothetical protein
MEGHQMAGDDTTQNSVSRKRRRYNRHAILGFHGKFVNGRRAVILQYNVHTCIYTVRSKDFRTDIFKYRRHMRKTHLFSFKISSIGIHTDFCAVVQLLRGCRKFLFLDLL